VGHPGPRSTGHEATEQPAAEGIIAIGRLNPSTTDTSTPQHIARTHVQPLHQSRPLMSAEGIKKKEQHPTHRRKSRDFRCPRASTPPLSQAGHPASCWEPRVGMRQMSSQRAGTEGRRTVPVWGSHWSPPLQPPSRQAFGPLAALKLHSRRP
jgi:hypothetical protein